MIFKLIFNFLKRVIQLAVIVFFGYWLYHQLFVGGLEYAMLTMVTMPFLIGGLIVGLLISLIYAFKGSIFKPIRIYNKIMLLAYCGAVIYLAIQIL